MQFRKVGFSKTRYILLKDYEAGDVLVEGVYTGSFEGKFGPLFRFETNDGEVVAIPAKGQLSWIMENHVEEGDTCRVTYAGKVMLEGKTKYAGKEAHQFEVEVMEDNLNSRRNSKLTPSKLSSPLPTGDDIMGLETDKLFGE